MRNCKCSFESSCTFATFLLFYFYYLKKQVTNFSVNHIYLKQKKRHSEINYWLFCKCNILVKSLEKILVCDTIFSWINQEVPLNVFRDLHAFSWGLSGVLLIIWKVWPTFFDNISVVCILKSKEAYEFVIATDLYTLNYRNIQKIIFCRSYWILIYIFYLYNFVRGIAAIQA